MMGLVKAVFRNIGPTTNVNQGFEELRKAETKGTQK